MLPFPGSITGKSNHPPPPPLGLQKPLGSKPYPPVGYCRLALARRGWPLKCAEFIYKETERKQDNTGKTLLLLPADIKMAHYALKAQL